MNKPCSLIAILTGLSFSHTSCVGNEKTIVLNTSTVEDFNKINTIALPISLLASSQPSYAESGQSLFGGNFDFVQELNKIKAIAPNYQYLNNHSFNCVAKVAVTGNNLKQELQNLFKSVQHHTIVGVFFCLSFSNLPSLGKLCLALALVYLWWGGDGNKPFIRRIPSAVDLTVLNLPAALHLGLITQTSLPVRKV